VEMSVRSPLARSSNGSGPSGLSGPPDLEVAVIGAGPHGLAATAHLRRAGVQAQLFGRPLAFWKSMPEGMVLRSNLRASHLIEPTGPLSVAAFAAASGVQLEQPVLLENFIAYGTWVQQLAVPDLDERTVTALDRDRHAFTLQLQDGERVTARRVVLACGIEPFQSMPPGYEHLPSDRVSHTGRYRDMGIFAGRRVALVGGGQSSFTCAALMRAHGAGGLEVLVRDDAVTWLRGHSVTKRLGRLGPILYAPTDVGPLWYSRLVATPALFRRLPRVTQDRIAYRSIRPACSHVVRMQLGDTRISTGVEVLGADLDGDALRVSLSDGSTREVDHLMFGTGYAIDIARYAFLSEGILGELRRREGYPILRRGLETSVPGLHVLGAPAAWSFGPIMRFISGSWYGGRAVARTIAGGSRARLGGGVRP
jgi:hypothetical protein